MGREIRRVPADWRHPKKSVPDYRIGEMVERYQPMRDRPFGPAMDEWYAAWKAHEANPPPEAKGMPYWEWRGGPPDPDYYRPDWPDESRTHLMMYEDTSEGTPISPAFRTPEEVARWCADNGASAFGHQTGSYEGWLAIARGGFAIGLAVIDGEPIAGVDLAATPSQEAGA